MNNTAATIEALTTEIAAGILTVEANGPRTFVRIVATGAERCFIPAQPATAAVAWVRGEGVAA